MPVKVLAWVTLSIGAQALALKLAYLAGISLRRLQILGAPIATEIAERLFNVWRKAGTDAWYIERDIDEELFWWKKEDYPQQGVCAQLRKGEDWIMRLTSARLFHVAKATA